jgi:molybdopterin molybdotransferase
VIPLPLGGASILSSTTRADGVVIVAEDAAALAAGTPVEVLLY